MVFISFSFVTTNRVLYTLHVCWPFLNACCTALKYRCIFLQLQAAIGLFIMSVQCEKHLTDSWNFPVLRNWSQWTWEHFSHWYIIVCVWLIWKVCTFYNYTSNVHLKQLVSKLCKHHVICGQRGKRCQITQMSKLASISTIYDCSWRPLLNAKFSGWLLFFCVFFTISPLINKWMILLCTYTHIVICKSSLSKYRWHTVYTVLQHQYS